MLSMGDEDHHFTVDVDFGVFVVGAGAMSGFGDAKCSLAFDDNHFRPPVVPRRSRPLHCPHYNKSYHEEQVKFPNTASRTGRIPSLSVECHL